MEKLLRERVNAERRNESLANKIITKRKHTKLPFYDSKCFGD
jgi:hypothetical protein